MYIGIKQIEDVNKMLKTDLSVEIHDTGIRMQCNNKCRLLSHLLHKAGLTEVHCNKDGLFDIPFKTYNISEILIAFDDIFFNPQWIIEFVEKYIDNEFVLTSTFRKVEA